MQATGATEKRGGKGKKKRRIIWAGVAVLLLASLAVGGWLYVDSLAYKLCIREK